MRILVLTLMMSFLSHSAFGTARESVVRKYQGYNLIHILEAHDDSKARRALIELMPTLIGLGIDTLAVEGFSPKQDIIRLMASNIKEFEELKDGYLSWIGVTGKKKQSSFVKEQSLFDNKGRANNFSQLIGIITEKKGHLPTDAEYSVVSKILERMDQKVFFEVIEAALKHKILVRGIDLENRQQQLGEAVYASELTEEQIDSLTPAREGAFKDNIMQLIKEGRHPIVLTGYDHWPALIPLEGQVVSHCFLTSMTDGMCEEMSTILLKIPPSGLVQKFQIREPIELIPLFFEWFVSNQHTTGTFRTFKGERNSKESKLQLMQLY
jgi:hypothetical protein